MRVADGSRASRFAPHDGPVSGGSWPFASATAPAPRDRALPFRRAHARHRWGRVHRPSPRPRAGRARRRRRGPRRPVHGPGSSPRCLARSPRPPGRRRPRRRRRGPGDGRPRGRGAPRRPALRGTLPRRPVDQRGRQSRRHGHGHGGRCAPWGPSGPPGRLVVGVRRRPGLPRRETQTPAPRSPYAVSKLAAEGIVHEVGARSGIEPWCSATSTCTGRARTRARATPQSCPASSSRPSRATRSRFHGDGHQSRDFTYVGDVVAANLLAISSRATGLTCNVAGGRERSLLDLWRPSRRRPAGDSTSATELRGPGTCAARWRTCGWPSGPSAIDPRSRSRTGCVGPSSGTAPGSRPRPSGRSRRSRPRHGLSPWPPDPVLRPRLRPEPAGGAERQARLRRTSWRAGVTGWRLVCRGVGEARWGSSGPCGSTGWDRPRPAVAALALPAAGLVPGPARPRARRHPRPSRQPAGRRRGRHRPDARAARLPEARRGGTRWRDRPAALAAPLDRARRAAAGQRGPGLRRRRSRRS